jgi:enoyl-CoA hydratase/carnithine racemase
MGLVHRVVSRDELMQTAEAWAQRLASFDQRAVQAAKEAVRRGMDLPLPQALELEGRLAERLGDASARVA